MKRTWCTSAKVLLGWMNRQCLWVDRVLQPYIETAPPGVMPIIFLDSYRCHMMASVVTKIEDLGVEVQHIPGVGLIEILLFSGMLRFVELG